jgi:predicted Rossmann-fold nucleotide-binding protein
MVQVSVIGSGLEHEVRAETVGRLLAEQGATVVTGGLGEVMAAAAGNDWLDHVVVTGIGHGRNLAVVASGDAVIAVGGRYGTLAEIGFALTLGRPVVVLEPGWKVDGTERAQTPEEAVEFALAGVRDTRVT